MTDDVAVWIWMIAGLGYVLALAGLLVAVRAQIKLSVFADEINDRVDNLEDRVDYANERAWRLENAQPSRGPVYSSRVRREDTDPFYDPFL